jgi:hypothetical protein
MDPARRRPLILAAIAVALVVGSALVVMYAPAPFAIVLAAWGAAGIAGAIRTRRRTRVVLANLGAIAIVLLGFEVYFWAQRPAPASGAREWVEWSVLCDDLGAYGRRDDVLGTVPGPKCHASEVKHVNDAVAYRAAYTHDAHGWRVSGDPASTADVALFFGDSFTYGQGVNDAEAYPAVFEKIHGGALDAITLAFPGWGPHHALRVLQRNRETPAVGRRRVRYGVYMGAGFHAERAAGLVWWDQHGPRYRFDDKGVLTSAGQFDDEWEAEPGWKTVLRRSYLASALLDRVARRTGPSWEAQLDLVVAIVKETAHVFEEHYHAPFYVIWWTDAGNTYIVDRLRAAGLNVFLIEEILPDAWAAEYHLADGHPTALAHERIGAALARLMPP